MKTAITSFWMITCLFASVAANPISLTLEECLNLANKENTSLKINRLQYASDLQAKKNAWNTLFPEIAVSAAFSTTSGSGTSTSNTTVNTISPGTSISLGLNSGISEEIKQKNLALESSALTLESIEAQLSINVEKAFYYLLTLENNLKLLKTDKDIAYKRFLQAESDYSNGYISELSKLQSEMSYAKTIPTIEAAESEYRNQLRNFAHLLGMTANEEISLNGELKIASVNLIESELIQNNLNDRFDIRQLENEIETLQSQKNSALAGNLGPTIKIGATWNSSITTENISSLGDAQWSDLLTGSISISLPLDGFIPGSKKNLALKNLDVSIAQAELNLQSVRSKAEIEILNIVEQIRTGEKNIELNELNLNLATKTYEMTEKGYTEGTVEFLELEDAQKEVLSASQKLLSSKYDYLSALLNLRFALGNKVFPWIEVKSI
ncbi:TolC family protein [candidate division KSB1 bacterium]|nr:TolC family protein [candidate division KSB1 bacterium]